MSSAPRTPQPTVTPRRVSAMTITVWVFVVVEALGIGFFLWTY